MRGERLRRSLKRVLYRWTPRAIFDATTVMYWRWQNFVEADYEPECALLERFIRPGDLVVDLGVNYGQYAARMARLVGTSGQVVGFEAVPATRRIAQ